MHEAHLNYHTALIHIKSDKNTLTKRISTFFYSNRHVYLSDVEIPQDL